MKNLFIYYPKCSTCRKAKKWLDEKGIDYSERFIVEDNPTKEELKKWSSEENIPLTKFFNTSGKLYREMQLKDVVKTAPDEKLLELLSSNGMLVKRPILVKDKLVLIGFKEGEWEGNLK
ncbi:arsenate reductase family protein [Wukongibacter baidiensis]|uniref:arsenate reductase family protein n=1 Tax=Wukongibacter baidiensis TaxID=1723361 RepID=UPI003D7F71B6